MSVKLFVGNIAASTTGDEIQGLFAAVGAVDSCTLIMDRATGQSRGFGFVEMHSKEAAEAAKQELNGLYVRGRILTVKDVKAPTKVRSRAG